MPIHIYVIKEDLLRRIMNKDQLDKAINIARDKDLDKMYLYAELLAIYGETKTKTAATVFTNKEYTEYFIFSNLVVLNHGDTADKMTDKERLSFYFDDLDFTNKEYTGFTAMEWVLDVIMKKELMYSNVTFQLITQHKLIHRGLAKSLDDLLEEINPESDLETSP